MSAPGTGGPSMMEVLPESKTRTAGCWSRRGMWLQMWVRWTGLSKEYGPCRHSGERVLTGVCGREGGGSGAGACSAYVLHAWRL